MVSRRIVTKTRKLPVKTFPLVRRIANSRGGEKKYFRTAQERNTNDEVNRNPKPKILPCDVPDGGGTIDASAVGEGIHTPECQDLAQLVWKYFEKEIRETMIEVQEAIQAEHSSSTGQISQRKQKRK